jgi:adenylate cyclase
VSVNTSDWEAAGLYDPDAPEADDRRALLEYLTQRGATLEQMVEAHRLGSLPAVAGELATEADEPQVNVKEIAERSGIDVPRVLRALLAAGIPATPDTELPADLVDFMAAFEQGSALMGDDAILALTRVMGASAMSIAEAAVALFYAELGPGTDREGATEFERAKVAEAAVLAFASVPGIVARMVEDQFEAAQRRALVERGWEDGEDGTNGPRGAQDVLVALGFVDLVGSTAWAQRVSLRDQNLALARFESAAWSSAVLAGGRVVKTIGDEVFFAAPTADAAVRIGTEVCRAAEDDEVLPPARGVVGFGLATPREGDYFGPLINQLSRMVKVGQPGQLVVTDAAAAHLSAEEWSLHEIDLGELRGIEGPVRAFTVAPQATTEV